MGFKIGYNCIYEDLYNIWCFFPLQEFMRKQDGNFYLKFLMLSRHNLAIQYPVLTTQTNWKDFRKKKHICYNENHSIMRKYAF